MKKTSTRKKFLREIPLNIVNSNDPAPTEQNTPKFINRDLSWVEFNARVLCQSADKTVPLLERIKFLGIVTSNFDEFFMKRLGRFKTKMAAGFSSTSVDGLNIKQQMVAIRKKIQPLLQQQDIIFSEDIKPSLREENIFLLNWEDLTDSEKEYASEYFRKKIFPLLTPLSVDVGHPFPFISNLSTSLGFALSHPGQDELLFARVKTSGLMAQWVEVEPDKSDTVYRFISLLDIVRQHAQSLFPGMKVVSSMPFRVTRNTDLEVDDDETEDILELVEKELRERRLGQIVRLEHGPNPDPWILSFLLEELELMPEDVYEISSDIKYTDLKDIADLDISKLRFPRWTPVTPPRLLEEKSVFSAIRNHDLMVHHPYESFSTTVERFVREACDDPKVLSVKMTVYRVGQVTPLIPYLIQAADRGKQVICFVELKARFDEKQNIHWAHMLEQAGVHVVYGVPGLKTHAKTLLVVRQDSDAIRCYAHFGTGNYHTSTANFYTDIGLFTSKPEFTEDLVHFFNFLTGRSLKDDYQKLYVAPHTLEKKVLSLISREIDHAGKGKPAHIIAKMNSLEDYHIIEELYRASQAGVKIDLIVRGICSLRPGVPGMSENIRVISVVGRLLEHSRIFHFRNAAEQAADGEFFMSSADWMFRNMHRRVELMVPIEDRSHRERCLQMMNMTLEDCRQTWELSSEGSYARRLYEPGKNELGIQEALMKLTSAPGSS